MIRRCNDFDKSFYYMYCVSVQEFVRNTILREGGLVLVAVELLYIYSVLSCQALQYARLVELLASAEFLNDTSLFKLSLELLQGAFNVFALFYLYYDHLGF